MYGKRKPLSRFSNTNAKIHITAERSAEVLPFMKNLLDRTDLEILSILQENARTPIKTIAARVFISPPTVAARIDEMEKAGIILGYHAKISDSILGHPVRAFINLEVTPERKAERSPSSRLLRRHRSPPYVRKIPPKKGRRAHLRPLPAGCSSILILF